MAEHSSREPAIEGLHPGQAPSQAAGAWDWHGTTDDGRIAVEKVNEILCCFHHFLPRFLDFLV